MKRLIQYVIGAALVGLTLTACDSGSLGSDVGSDDGVVSVPLARAQVLNGGENNTFRSGSEVLLTGKDSEDTDGPIVNFDWEQVAGTDVTLVERNATTISLTTPDVVATETLRFELTVTGSDGGTATSQVEITVVPFADSNEFLSFDVQGNRDVLDSFQVVPALMAGATTDASAEPLELAANAYLLYAPRDRATSDCVFDANDFMTATTTGFTRSDGCRIQSLGALTSSGATVTNQWPGNISVPASQSDAEALAAYWNPRITLPVPRLDIADFNQQFVESGDRGLILDDFRGKDAQVIITLELTSMNNQSDAGLLIATNDGNVVSNTPNDGIGLPTFVAVPLEDIFREITGRESSFTAEVYYNTIDPDRARTTLNDWLFEAGFASDRDGTLFPDAEAGNGDFAHAIYVNNFDLGFGRDMYSRVDEFGNVYAFVENYPTLETAFRRNNRIVTVVMEYSPLGDPADTSAEKFVKFFTFIDDGAGDAVRITSMNFDGRGERFTPGNCTACHGGLEPPGANSTAITFNAALPNCSGMMSDPACFTMQLTDGMQTLTPGDLKATFLPWDLDSLLFVDTDPAITNSPTRLDGTTVIDDINEFAALRGLPDMTRSGIEEQLRKLNQHAYSTYVAPGTNQAARPETEAAVTLMGHWYDVDSTGTLSGEWDDSEPAPGWRSDELVAGAMEPNPADADVIYRDVYAQHCRMCHTNITEETLRFDSYDKFRAQFPLVESAVYQQGVMPGARLTMDRFWVRQEDGPLAKDVLAAHLGLDPSVAEVGPSSAASVTEISETAERSSAEPVRLTADTSVLANAFDWSVAYTPPSELVGRPGVTGYTPVVTGNGTVDFAVLPEQPGTYDVSVVINGAGDSPPDSLTDGQSFSVTNFTPVACPDLSSAMPGDVSPAINFLSDDRFVANENAQTFVCGDAAVRLEASRDLPLSYAFNVPFDNGAYPTPQGGLFELSENLPCALATPVGCSDDVLTYTAPPATDGNGDPIDSFIDSLTYSLVDVDGDSLNGVASSTVSVQVTANLTAPVQTPNPSVPTLGSVGLSFEINGGEFGPPGSRYRVTLITAPQNGAISRNGVQQSMSAGDFFDTDGLPMDTDFTYTANLRLLNNNPPDVIRFRVTDSSTGSADAVFTVNIAPRAPFTLVRSLLRGGQFPDEPQVPNLTCNTCHSGSVTNATAVLDLRGDRNNLFDQLRNGGGGVVKANPLLSPLEDNPILCFPDEGVSTNCRPRPGGSPHDGGGNLYPDPVYDLILLWLQEGALNTPFPQ